MSDKIRLNMQVSKELDSILESIADDNGTTKTDVVRRALYLMQVAHEQRKKGHHLGFTTDSEKLDTEVIGF
ncbi:MAG: DNA-binding protein [Maricaulaceae bacterium]